MSSPSSPHQVICQEGVLLVPSAGRALSKKALEEALALELKGCVWEIVSRKTLPEGVELRYRYLSAKQWDFIKNLPPRLRPLTPQSEKERSSGVFLARLELGCLVLCSLVFLALNFSGVSLFLSNSAYAARLEHMLESRQTGPQTQTPQRAWVELLNRLSAEGVQVHGFEFGVSGGTLEIEKPVFGKLDAVKTIFTEVLPGKTVTAQKEGALWSFRE